MVMTLTMTPSAANEQMYKDDRKEKEEVKQQKCREYEMMLMRRLNLKKEISSLKRSFTTNELNIKDYESNEETKEFAHEVRERVWENRARKNWRSDTSFVNEHLELGYYVLSDRERELAAAAANSHL
jgi:exonuclease VII large subunit